MSTKSAFRVWAAAILLLTALAISGNTAIALNECNPPDGVGATSKDCGTLITIDDINGIVISHTGQPPYDRDSLNPGDDTLVGVRNNSSKPLRSMVLRSALPIFEFDTDGICGISFSTGQPFNHKPTGCPFKTGPGSTGYEGPRVSFTNLKPDFTEGTVRFDPEILSGGTTYFALEAAISAAFSCPAVINDSVTTQIESRTRIVADFTPGKVPSNTSATSAAALFCGVKKFNWVQKITYLPDPSPYNAINPSRHIASADTPFNDPPKGGWSYAPLWLSYPFHWDPNPPPCTPMPNIPCPQSFSLSFNDKGTHLHFSDEPADNCLLGGSGAGCGGAKFSGPFESSKITLTTRLVGVLRDAPNSPADYVDLGLGFDWESNFNGNTCSGVTTPGVPCVISGPPKVSNLDGVVPDSGTGGITITRVHNVTDYQYNGIVVTVLNDVPIEGETIPPAIMVSATPKRLWPPNHTMVPVTVSGTIKDIGGTGVNLSTAAYVVMDEYGLVQPKGAVILSSDGSYSFTIQLQASRKGDDKDGRQYHITVSAEDNAGNKGSSSTLVIVPHDQRHDRKHDRGHDKKDDQKHDERDDRGH